jgi:hypothetical protein
MRNQPRKLARTSAPVSPVRQEVEEAHRFKSLFEGEGEGIAQRAHPR